MSDNWEPELTDAEREELEWQAAGTVFAATLPPHKKRKEDPNAIKQMVQAYFSKAVRKEHAEATSKAKAQGVANPLLRYRR